MCFTPKGVKNMLENLSCFNFATATFESFLGNSFQKVKNDVKGESNNCYLKFIR